MAGEERVRRGMETKNDKAVSDFATKVAVP